MKNRSFAYVGVFLFVAFPFIPSTALADAIDAAGCKDSPLVQRFPGASITACVDRADDVHSFPVSSGPDKTLEGEYHSVSYRYPDGASKAQVLRNLHTAIQNAGYTFDRDTGDNGDFTVHQGKTWIGMAINAGSYSEAILTEKQFSQDVVAHAPPSDSNEIVHANFKQTEPDAQGCKDSSLIGRFPGASLTGCIDKPDDVHVFPMNNAPDKKLEGEFHSVSYKYPEGASKPQVLRNMHTALQNAGYSFDRDTGDNGDFTVHQGKIWIDMNVNAGSYSEAILIEKQVSQDVVANAAALAIGINASGHIVVDGILFDFNKSDLKPESAPALQEVAKLLQGDATLKLFVVGHTDNVGSVAANIELSRARAASVVKALTTRYGITASRLDPYGAGPYAPRASNDSEDGRTLNRRVEVVKQ